MLFVTGFLAFVLVDILDIGNALECSYIYDHGRPTANCIGLKLKYVPQNLSEVIVGLNLEKNEIEEITNNTFIKYKRLTYLNLNNNRISKVHFNGFAGLEKLKTLHIAKNEISILSHDVSNIFRHINGIQSLDISESLVTLNSSFYHDSQIYPDTMLQHFKKLKILRLDLYPHPIFGIGFKNLSITEIVFSNCHIFELKNTTFSNLPSTITSIELAYCTRIDMKKIEAGVFTPFSSLDSLDLSSTKISVQKGLELLYPFRNKQMKMINLGHMKTPRSLSVSIPYALTIQTSMMRHLETICVKKLFLHDNNIVDFAENSLLMLGNPKCLEHINLAGNRFGIPDTVPFLQFVYLAYNFTNLKTFDLSFLPLKFRHVNFIESVQTENVSTFDTDDNIKTDILNCEKQTDANINMFLPKKLEYIRITHVMGSAAINNLTLIGGENLRKIDMSYFEYQCFPNFILNNTNNIEYLDISGIDSSLYYTKKDIQLFRNLNTLVLRNVKLYKAMLHGKNVLTFAKRLKNLDISDNGVRFIDSDYFIDNKHLENLILSRNQFRQIPEAVTTLPGLKSLNMANNRMYSINNSLTAWFDGQREKFGNFTLFLATNEFHCTCIYRDFIRWLHTTKVTLDRNGNYTCILINNSLSSTLIVNEQFHELFSHCESSAWLKLGIILITSLFCIFLPVTIVYNFRWRIIMFTYRKLRKFMETGMHLSYTYDVYVAYSYNGYPWIKRDLMPLLEKDWKLSVCLDDRDLVSNAGQTNYGLIANAISESRHMIIYVTSDFMSKPFAEYEIDRAKAAKAAHTLQQIIVITADFNIENIPAEVKSIWSDISLVEWPSDDKQLKAVKDNLKTRVFFNF